MLLITMKRTPLYIALTAATLFASCSKQLDQFPSTSLPDDEAIESVASLHRAVNGAYSPSYCATATAEMSPSTPMPRAEMSR